MSQTHRSGVFIVNFEHILFLFPVFFIADFEQVNISWDRPLNNSNARTMWIFLLSFYETTKHEYIEEYVHGTMIFAGD